MSEELHPLDRDLMLHVADKYYSADRVRDGTDKYKYYTAGKVPSGKYKGYTRIVLVKHSEYQDTIPPISPDASAHLYVTDDFKTYVRDISSSPDLWLPDNPGVNLRLDDVDGYHPVIINIDDKFALIRDDIFVDYLGNLTVSFSNAQEIKDIKTDIKLYYYTGTFKFDHALFLNGLEKKIGDYLSVRDNGVIVGVDDTGLIYTYTLTTRSMADNYNKNKKAYIDAYGKDPDKFPFRYHKYIQTNMRLNRGDINSSVRLYNSYHNAFDTLDLYYPALLILRNVNDEDFSQIGKTGDIDLFVLKDKNHPLYKLQYERKLGWLKSDIETYKRMNNEATEIPSFESYVSSNPLLFFKDYWGRWNVLGEFEIAV